MHMDSLGSRVTSVATLLLSRDDPNQFMSAYVVLSSSSDFEFRANRNDAEPIHFVRTR